jgi:sulfur-oxidizing protein SoxX
MEQARPALSFFRLLIASIICLLPGRVILAADINPADIDKGMQIAFEPKKGNCLACHAIAGGNSPGSIAPTLVSMKARFPDREKLRQQIWDSRGNDPHTLMPPFGKFRILTDQEIERVIDYLYTL